MSVFGPVPKEPTGDQCSKQETWTENGRRYMAIWYPQMGGYVGKAVIEIFESDTPESCFEVYVWHDGEFPFTDENNRGRRVARLHHCAWQQFVTFGQAVARFQGLQ